ncbi:Sensor histidine kinase RcsC [Usitatibacter rugosus]|uniref:histidine kinase n=1 Tax=Usitatibacter rugosus TaxID=2732067 RepID=A0A6M4H0U8_9PROT|nr:response regulator [Usitatibacter rugosus]QJR12962.1 Sensor histidine kinase RcsC [Usitatibacter rugosus]
MTIAHDSDGALVLVVDDNEGGRYAKSRILQLAGFEVIEAGTGYEAIRLLKERRPELMVLDVRLPDLNGRHVVLRIRADPDVADVAVLQTSATHVDAHHKVLALEAGADAYLAEPVEPEELVANARALLRMRRAEKRLHQAESRFREMSESIGDVFWILDPVEMKFDYVSPAFETMWGRTVTDVMGDIDVWLDAIHPDDRKGALASTRQLVDMGTYNEEYRIRRPDKSERWIAVRGFPMRNAGTERRVAGVAQDITERKNAEAALLALDHRKDEFLAMLAHELRNPLGPIRNAVEILRIAPSERTEMHAKAREMIGRQVSHLARLVDDLLDVSRITQGKIALQIAPVRLEAVVHAALEMARPAIDANGLQVTVSLADEPLWIHADAVRLTQVIGNLLNNAAKFTPPGGHITLRGERRGDEVAIVVEDTGIGMASDLLPHVFELFAQGDRTLERTRGGLGVGLALVRRLVAMHGGSVKASSAGQGQGSRFEVLLPLMKTPAEASPGSAPARPAFVPRKILVVDDSRDSAEALAVLLEQSGHQVVAAFSAREALVKAKAFVPDVVFLDIGLPEMDGYSLARKMREMPETKSARILALTGYGQVEHREHALASGFDDHLTKPFDPAQLSQVIG